MIKCPRCGELIDENVYVCPKCWHIFNDGSNDKHEEWAIKMKKKDKLYKALALTFLCVTFLLGVVFFSLLHFSKKVIHNENGTTSVEYNVVYTVLTIVFFAMLVYSLIVCSVMKHRNVLVQTFDGYTVAVKTTLLFTIIYVQNKIVVKKTKNYHHDTYKVSLPNDKKVNIILTTEVCTFELSNE